MKIKSSNIKGLGDKQPSPKLRAKYSLILTGFQPWIELKSFPERITLLEGLFELNLDFSVKASSTKLLQTAPKEREWLQFQH